MKSRRNVESFGLFPGALAPVPGKRAVYKLSPRGVSGRKAGSSGSAALPQSPQSHALCGVLAALIEPKGPARRAAALYRLICESGKLEGGALRLAPFHYPLFFARRPEIGRDYPLNLSILLSGGKETNQDSLGIGE